MAEIVVAKNGLEDVGNSNSDDGGVGSCPLFGGSI